MLLAYILLVTCLLLNFSNLYLLLAGCITGIELEVATGFDRPSMRPHASFLWTYT
jgi:hypothetical protein